MLPDADDVGLAVCEAEPDGVKESVAVREFEAVVLELADSVLDCDAEDDCDSVDELLAEPVPEAVSVELALIVADGLTVDDSEKDTVGDCEAVAEAESVLLAESVGVADELADGDKDAVKEALPEVDGEVEPVRESDDVMEVELVPVSDVDVDRVGDEVVDGKDVTECENKTVKEVVGVDEPEAVTEVLFVPVSENVFDSDTEYVTEDEFVEVAVGKLRVAETVDVTETEKVDESVVVSERDGAVMDMLPLTVGEADRVVVVVGSLEALRDVVGLAETDRLPDLTFEADFEADIDGVRVKDLDRVLDGDSDDVIDRDQLPDELSLSDTDSKILTEGVGGNENVTHFVADSVSELLRDEEASVVKLDECVSDEEFVPVGETDLVALR
jgi:hypothetical protein